MDIKEKLVLLEENLTFILMGIGDDEPSYIQCREIEYLDEEITRLKEKLKINE